MRKQILLCLVLASLLCSCSARLAQEKFNSYYIAAKSPFANSLTSIFPRRANTPFSRLIGNSDNSHIYNRYTGLVYCVPYSDTLALSLKNKPHQANYSSTDENLLIVGRLGESTDEEYNKWHQNYDWNKSKDYIPIPNFHRLNYETLSFASDRNPLNNKLPEGYIIYVVDASPGVFIKKEWLTQGKGLPKEWKNGYSRGYAISNDKTKDIIYWLIVW